MKHSSKKSVQILAAHFKAANIKHLVISPGPRNAPLIIEFTQQPFFKNYSVVDERSAGFFALGMAQQLHEPVVLICSSGSAVLNYYPAIAEAFYSKIPLIVVSADRPQKWIDHGEGQTIRQNGVLEKHTHFDITLLEDDVENADSYNSCGIAQAVKIAFEQQGPVHINMPFDEPLYETVNKSDVQILPLTPNISDTIYSEDFLEDYTYKWLASKRKMIVVGQHKISDSLQQQLEKLAQDPTVIVLDENISNVRKRLEDLFEKVKANYKEIFKPHEKIELNDRVLKYVVSELQRFSFLDTDTDIKGEAYEEIVGANLRGDRGEFFTPRNVCNMAVEMAFSLFPLEKLLQPGGMKILDPAVGTGGFLIAGLNKIKQLLKEHLNLRYDELRDRLRQIADKNFYGIDFNPFLVKAAQMNMVMHGDGYSNIVHANSLENPKNWSEEVKAKIQLEIFDLVITNPPFSSKAKIDDPEILVQYEIAQGSTGLPPEQLFIERCYQFLKPGGIMVIVLPDSILSNPGLRKIREWILSKMQIIASIDLPTETFEPFTGTQTSILIMRKKTLEEIKEEKRYGIRDYEIFMAIPEKVGHDRRGNPLYKMTPEGNIILDEKGNPIIDDQLPIVAEIFKEWLRKTGEFSYAE